MCSESPCQAGASGDQCQAGSATGWSKTCAIQSANEWASFTRDARKRLTVYLKFQTIVGIAYRPPESDRSLVGDQHLHGQSLGPLPHLRAENFHRTPTNPLPATVTNHK